MPSVTSYEVAQLRTAFHALHAEFTRHNRTPAPSQESTTYTATGFDFEKNEAELSDLLARVKTKEIEVMDTITLKSLAAMQTREYDQYVSLLEEKKAELQRFSIHLEPNNVSHSVDHSKLARSTPSHPASAPTTPLKPKRAITTVTPPTSQSLSTPSIPVTPSDKVMSQDHTLSTSVAITSTPTVPTITITPPPKTPPSCPALQLVPSSPKPLPVLKTWSTQSPKKPESKPPTESHLQPAVEFGPKAIHSSPARNSKPARKPLDSPAKTIKAKSKVTKSPTAPTRRNPQRVPHSISRKIANSNIHTLSFPKEFETIDGTDFGDGFAFFTNKRSVATPQLIWNQRFPDAMSAVPFPDLPNGMSARALGNTLADYMCNTLKGIAQQHPDLEDLETGVTTMVSGIHHVLERIANVAEQTAVVINGELPVVAKKKAKLADAENRAPNPAREDAKDSKIKYLEGQVKALRDEVTYFQGEEKRYGAIMDDNEKLKTEVAELKVEVAEYGKEVSTDVEGELRDTKLQLDAALRSAKKMQMKIRGLERGTGKSIDEMLITMQASLEKNANADIDDGHYNYEEDDGDDLFDQGFDYGFAAPASRKRKAASE